MRKFRRLIVWGITIALLTVAFQPAIAFQNTSGFFRTQGKNIIDPDGNPVILRGIGLGGWLVPEGYMLHIPGFASPTIIHNMIENLIGPENTDHFYKLYEENYVNDKDVRQIAQWGFNSIRLPFHYNRFYDPSQGTFREEGFKLLDTFLDWCKIYDLYVILDMHCAPGGQNPDNTSDSNGVARLWTEPTNKTNQDLTVKIWKEIARRYANESRIIGYDLLNEPVLPSGHSNSELRGLYERLAREIREVDPNHILFIEGNWYATDFTLLTPPFDGNMVYSFHKYWDKTGIDTIQKFLDIRNQYNVPLWLGESGENSNPWIYETIQLLMEKNGIGWNFWTYKKVETITSPLSAPFSEGYQNFLDYWNGKVSQPPPNPENVLFEMAQNLSIEKCDRRPDVVPALLDPNFGSQSKSFKELTIPGIINAVDYDIGTNGNAYFDRDYKNEEGLGGPAWNKGWQYRNNGVDIEESKDPEGFEYNVGWIESDEWINYTVNILTENDYDIDIRVASISDQGRLRLLLDNKPLADDLSILNTGGWQNWTSVNIHNVHLPAGIHELKLHASEGGFNINRLRFELITGKPVPDVKANDLDDPISIASSDNLSVKVKLDPGSLSSNNADWWVAANTTTFSASA